MDSQEEKAHKLIYQELDKWFEAQIKEAEQLDTKIRNIVILIGTMIAFVVSDMNSLQYCLSFLCLYIIAVVIGLMGLILCGFSLLKLLAIYFEKSMYKDRAVDEWFKKRKIILDLEYFQVQRTVSNNIFLMCDKNYKVFQKLDEGVKSTKALICTGISFIGIYFILKTFSKILGIEE